MGTYDNRRIKFEDLANNTATRLPLIMCIDASASMYRYAKKINDGINKLITDMQNDDYAADAVELCIISFGNNRYNVCCPFDAVKKAVFKNIIPDGNSPIGTAVKFALKELDDRVSMYGEVGIDKYKPWLIIISDGNSSDDIMEVSSRVRKMQQSGELKVFPISIGSRTDSLKKFSADEKIYRMDDFRVDKFFSWLSKSMSKQGQSFTGEEETIPLDFLIEE